MQGFRPVVFTVYPAGQTLLRAVTLYEDTWQNHIVPGHPDVAPRLHDVEMTVAAPSVIYASSSLAGSYLFVKAGIVDPVGRSLRVIVRPVGSISSAYFSSATGGSQLWP